MEITYAADTEQLDQFVKDVEAEILAERERELQGTPSGRGEIRLRVQPTVRRGGNYVAWPGVSWLVSCQSADEAIAVREALRACFEAMAARGPAKVRTVLTALD